MATGLRIGRNKQQAEPNRDNPEHHPVNTFIDRSSGFIPGNSWEPGCAMDTLFRPPELAQFLADCLEVPELYCYAAIFAYTEQPYVIGRVTRTQQLY